MTRRSDDSREHILIVAPACREWDFGGYLLEIFASRALPASAFAYAVFETAEAANAALLDRVRAERPRVVLGLKLDRIFPQTVERMREAGAFVLLWYNDCFTEQVPRWIVPLVSRVDAFLTTAKGMVGAYEALSATPVAWVPEGAHLPAFPAIEVEPARRPLYASQVAFLGNVFQPPVADERLALRRLRLLSQVGERYGLKVWGPQSPDFDRDGEPFPFRVLRWPAYNDECVRVCRSADVVLGMNTVDTVECYFSARTFTTLASGGFHLTSYVPGLETMFKNHEHLVWYRSDDECLELIEHYLGRPDERTRIATSGRRHVRARYAMDGRVDEVLRIVETHYGTTRDR